MCTCPPWRAWLLAAPELWPMTVLRFPARQCDIWEEGDAEHENVPLYERYNLLDFGFGVTPPAQLRLF